MLKNYKIKYIAKLKSYEKRAILFINGHDEYDFSKLEEMSLRKIIYVKWSFAHVYINNRICEAFRWEEELPGHLVDPNWHYKQDLEDLSVPNNLEGYIKDMYEVTNKYETFAPYRKILCPQRRREDLDKYFHVEQTEYNSRVMVYEASDKHLYTMLIYTNPFWRDTNHVMARLEGGKSLYRDDNIRLGAEMYGMEELLRNNIELNTPKEQEMLKKYTYTTVLYLSFHATATHTLYFADVNKNLKIE